MAIYIAFKKIAGNLPEKIPGGMQCLKNLPFDSSIRTKVR